MEMEWKTSKEILNKFQITPQTLNNWRRLGVISYIKINKRNFLYQFPETKIIRENESPKSL